MKAELNVIKKVLDFLCKTINVDYEIIEHHDESERNRPACDAIARVSIRNVAVEHTSIDSFPSQRTDDKRFIKVLGSLEKELTGKLPTPGHYVLSIPANAIPTGINWADIRFRISEWCQRVAPNLEIGDPSTALQASVHFFREVPQGVPFEVTLYRWPGRDGQFFTARFCPSDLENQREQVIYRALTSRGAKVASYRSRGFRTILILESNGIALANASAIGQAFVNAMKKVDSTELPDEVYLVETEVEPYYFHCLKFGDKIFPDVVISEKPYI